MTFRQKFSQQRFLTTACLLGCFIFGTLSDADAIQDPSVMKQAVGIDEHLNEHIRLDLPFTDSNGETRPLREFLLEGRPAVVTPVYYGCPRLCQLTLTGVVNSLKELKLKLGEDYSVLTVSIKPTETPEDAKLREEQYTSQLTPEAGNPHAWKFLVGRPDSVNTLMTALGFRYQEDEGEFAHVPGIMVISPQGTISRYLYGVEFEPRDLRFSLVEAAQGRIGDTFSKILLYCYRFDATHGKYTFAVMNLVRVVSIVVFFSVATLIYKLR